MPARCKVCSLHRQPPCTDAAVLFTGAPILVQPAVYSNGFQPGGSQANAGAGQTPYGQNTNGQTGYGQNIFG